MSAPSAPGARGDLVAHGLGGGADLPIPPELAIAGGSAALTLSFVILLLAWRRPRYGDATVGRPVPARLAAMVDSTGFAVVLRVLGLVALAWTLWAAVAGRDSLVNPVFGIGFVWLWVGIVPLSLLLGPVFKAISPARTLHLLIARATGDAPDQGLRGYPAGWGYWPAALTLFAFVWLELVYPYATELGPFRLWFSTYLAIMVVGSAVFGSRWLERADPFEVYSTLLAHLSVWGRDDAGVLVWRSPLRNLAQLRGEPGLVAVVAVLLGSTAYDSFRDSLFWLRWSQSFAGDFTLVSTVALLTSLLIVGGTFTAATMATGVDRGGTGRWSLPGGFAHSVVPIIVGYMVAHYLTFLVEEGQRTLARVSDPLTTGANYLGTADLEVGYWLSLHPTLLASIKVLAIVVGHVLGVIAAHDRAIRVLPARHQVTGQLPLLAAMVLYTFGGLYLLFGT